MKLLFLMDRIRRVASKMMALIVPNSNRLKLKVKALFSMYKVFPLRSKSSEKRVICYYRAKGPFAPGLADRLKCMVSGFVISRENNRAYYIYHDQGFLLEDYLVPASVNWSIHYDDISLGVLSCKRLWFENKIVKLDDSIAEYHFLSGGDIVEKLTDELKDKYNFAHLFHSLFRPSELLRNTIEAIKDVYSLRENEYIAIHARFLDFFENVEQKRVTAFTRHASPEEQQQMIESVNRTIRHISCEHEGKKVLLFSDSPTFLAAPHPEGVCIIQGEVGHIYAHAGNKDVTLKAFSDLFIISQASHIYSIVGPGTHASGYSYLAARVGARPFRRIERM